VLSSPDLRPEPTRTLPRAQRRASILTGAAQAFAQGGFAATSLDAISAACGVSTIIIYRHFDTKESLYREVLALAAARQAAALADPTDPSGIDVGALLRAARDDQDGFRLLWRHALRETQFSAAVDALREQAVGAVRAAQDGRVEPGFLEWAAHATVSYAVAAVFDWLDYGDAKDDTRFVKATRQALRAGVRSWSQG
jgi:AcrR family transcriptional regulator